jgi:uncharacterized protein (TIGR02145 family)
MSLRKLNSIFWIAAALIVSSSCKKDDDKTTPSLHGTLSFKVTEFVNPGHLMTMTPKGITHPKDEGIGYSWKVTPGMTYSDTVRLQNGMSPEGKPSDGSFSYRFGDSLATYTVSCTAFAKGYTSSYYSAYVTVVKPGLDETLTGTGIKAADPSITAGNNKYYYTNPTSELDWMRNNLAVEPYGAPYENAKATSYILGRYYSYEEALQACPEGWRLPTDQEWRELAKHINSDSEAGAYETIPGIAADFMADVSFNSNKMWEYWPQVGEITNKAKIAVIPAGYANLGERSEDGTYPNASFLGTYEYAVFWTADLVENEPGMAYYRYIFCDQPDMYAGKGDTKTFGASVRCVRDAK